MSRAAFAAKSKSVKHRGGVSKLLKTIEQISGEHQVKIGFPAGSKDYPDGTSVMNVALWNELGTVNAPARPFLRPGIRENTDKYVALGEGDLVQIQHGKLSPDQALSRLGIEAEADVKQKIRDVKEPPKVATSKNEGKMNPLILSGHMRNSVTHEVMNNGSG